MSNLHKPWLAQQTWEDLLFIHWPVAPSILAPFIPSPLELDHFKDSAWISIVPFLGTNNKARKLGEFLSLSPFLELNVRTYVKYKGEHGVYFLTMDADSPLAVIGARMIAGLPYFHAVMKHRKKQGIIHYSSQRRHNSQPDVSFSCNYAPVSEPYYPAASSLTYWLTERYSLWKAKQGKVTKGPIYHEPWKLQEAKLELHQNQLLNFLPEPIGHTSPLVHYCPTKHVKFYPFERLN